MSPYFQERQTFTQWWLWLVVGATTLGINILFINAVIQQLIMGVPWGDKPLSDEALVIISVVVLTASTGLSLLFFNSVMEVRVDRRAIEYRFAPLIRDWKRIERDSIRGFRQRRNYFAGYGVKRSFDGTRILTVKGTDGVEVTLDNGSRIFFGTQQPTQFVSAVEKMVNSNQV